jgi:NADH-quinone oxidoreductase subunit A
MPALVGSMLLFVVIGVGFILIHLLVGKLIRPAKPDAEKMTIYECGEPTIGSAWVQFDLRFYVVALLFVIFDVEVAFFFPWALVYGKANTLSRTDIPAEERVALTVGNVPAENKVVGEPLVPPYPENAKASQQFRNALADPKTSEKAIEDNRNAANQLGWLAFGDILVFFGVLLVGFAYLWKRGDLNWVRSTAAERVGATGAEAVATTEKDALVGVGS